MGVGCFFQGGGRKGLEEGGQSIIRTHTVWRARQGPGLCAGPEWVIRQLYVITAGVGLIRLRDGGKVKDRQACGGEKKQKYGLHETEGENKRVKQQGKGAEEPG